MATAADFPITRQELPEGVRLLENVYLTMRDGVKVAIDVYLPENEGRYPVILAICPYKKEAQALSPNRGFHSEGGDLRFFVPRGYAMVFATARGAGFSQGEYDAWGPAEQQDGYDIVEEIAKQSWCDGNIGMLGGSYLGMSQWYTAAQRPPHLRCITPDRRQYRSVPGLRLPIGRHAQQAVPPVLDPAVVRRTHVSRSGRGKGSDTRPLGPVDGRSSGRPLLPGAERHQFPREDRRSRAGSSGRCGDHAALRRHAARILQDRGQTVQGGGRSRVARDVRRHLLGQPEVPRVRGPLARPLAERYRYRHPGRATGDGLRQRNGRLAVRERDSSVLEDRVDRLLPPVCSGRGPKGCAEDS